MREEQLGEILKVADRSWWKRVELIGGYSLQVRGKDPPQAGVISRMNHHLVLILAEMLDRVALTRLTVKCWNRELLGKFTFQYALEEERVGCIGGDGSESAMVWHSCFLDLLPYNLVEILDMEKLFGLPLSIIMLISHMGTR